MEIKTSNDVCILTPLSPKLDKRECLRIFSEIKAHSFLKIGLDLNFVEECTIDFIEALRGFQNISIFNIPSDIFVLFNLMGIDKNANLYVSELDFMSNSRQILNRKFFVV